MPDPAQINRSLSTIRTELEFLQASNVLSGPQFQSIMAQLPGQNGMQAQYVDPKFATGQPMFNPSMHHEWAKNMASRFGSAVVFGAGATFGGDMVNDALKHF
ncbi:hypothetical protein OIDMADRAFT_112043 [Oidiodendron maius Zn]|uniref:Uncharacterized protein n=1 Tax=Oidiodendron maius (strain Zn) TaxID=913774 RepID=A0A0C3D4T9_OIDMZ|nr:hypothetical protein OIDMADRAFT_112043 [Oidiodendron maius Zn]